MAQRALPLTWPCGLGAVHIPPPVTSLTVGVFTPFFVVGDDPARHITPLINQNSIHQPWGVPYPRPYSPGSVDRFLWILPIPNHLDQAMVVFLASTCSIIGTHSHPPATGSGLQGSGQLQPQLETGCLRTASQRLLVGRALTQQHWDPEGSMVNVF